MSDLYDEVRKNVRQETCDAVFINAQESAKQTTLTALQVNLSEAVWDQVAATIPHQGLKQSQVFRK